MTEAELKAIEQRAKAEIEEPWNPQSELLARNVVALIAEVRRLQGVVKVAAQHIADVNAMI